MRRLFLVGIGWFGFCKICNGDVLLWGVERVAEAWDEMAPNERYRALSYTSKIIGVLTMLNAVRTYQARLETTTEDRWRIAVHESGHAVAIVSREDKKSYDDKFISGIQRLRKGPPRFELRGVRLNLGALSGGEAGGVTVFRFRRKLLAMEAMDIQAMLSFVFAGRAAEDILLGRGSAGAAGDLEIASYIARAYVDLCFSGPHSARGLYDTKQAERATRYLLEASYRDALFFARKNKNKINYMARALFLKEKLSAKEARSLVNDAIHNRPPPIDPKGIFIFHDQTKIPSLLRSAPKKKKYNTNSHGSKIRRVYFSKKRNWNNLPVTAPSCRSFSFIILETARFLRSVLVRFELTSLFASTFSLLADKAAVDAAEREKAAAAKKVHWYLPSSWPVRRSTPPNVIVSGHSSC